MSDKRRAGPPQFNGDEKMFLHSFIGAISLALIISTAVAQQARQSDTNLLVTGEGIVVPARSWDVSAEVSNQITKIHFVRGQQVKKGELLVEMDTYFKKLDVELAEVSLLRVNAALKKAKENLQRQTTKKIAMHLLMYAFAMRK
jgi:multidrug efflux pump subunit AcrA (membrane-fusion protein)